MSFGIVKVVPLDVGGMICDLPILDFSCFPGRLGQKIVENRQLAFLVHSQQEPDHVTA